MSEQQESLGGLEPHQDVEMQNHENDAATSYQDNKSGMDYMAAHTRDLITVIRSLERLQIDATLRNLPKIVVTGDQSHGKSSIIEGLCEFKLPRGEGTCTRCPIQITTSASKDGVSRSCIVRLQLKFKYLRGAWKQRDSIQYIEFATITDFAELERVLRLAQVAILKPSCDPSQVLRQNDTNAHLETEFSKNVIALDIEGPGLQDLSFYDLPGAINMYDGSDGQKIVPFIEDLIKSYVGDEKALVLLAVSANQDIHNSTAFRFVSECNARDRCMGVFTKPDLIHRKGAQVTEALRGESFKLKLGWFVTKQPSQDQLDNGITHSQARVQEAEFFDLNEPWTTMPDLIQARLGTHKLAAFLSEELRTHILNELPNIRERVNDRLEQINTSLQHFPAQTKVPCAVVSNEISDIVTVIREQLQGRAEGKPFTKGYQNFLRELWDQLQENGPCIDYATPGFAISIDSDNEPVETPTKGRGKKRNIDGQELPVRPVPQTNTPRQRQNATTTRGSKKNEEPIGPVTITLKYLNESYRDATMTGLPNEVDGELTHQMLKKFTQHWTAIVGSTVQIVSDFIHNMLKYCIHQVLASRKETKLFDEAIRIVENLLRVTTKEVTETISLIVKEESKEIIWKNRKAWEEVCDRKAKEIKMCRDQKRVEEFYDSKCFDSKTSTPQHQKEKNFEKTLASLGPDEFQTELDWIVNPLVYYEIASTRVSETTALLLQCRLLNALDVQLPICLRDELHADDTEHCAMLLVEDPQREIERQGLLMERERLMAADDVLCKLTDPTATQQ